MQKNPQRRLAAIASLDVVGYSRLIGSDELATLKAMETLREELISPLVTDKEGRIVKTMGDGLLLEFTSAINATLWALEVQRGLAERNRDLEACAQITVRIGINLGDIVIQDDDIFGDGVNVAARLQELAKPGTVCVSAAVHNQTAGRIDQQFDDLGYQKLKNIAHPVRVYQAKLLEGLTEGGRSASWPFISAVKDKQPFASGGCLCGKVRYEIWGEPAGVGYCHCRMCQLALGAPLNAWAAFKKSLVTFVGDHPKVYRSSRIAKRAFCENCGTSLYTDIKGPQSEEYYSIRLATLDNPEDFPPTCHFGVENQLPWLDINDDLPRLRTGDDPELAASWQRIGQPKDGPARMSAKERALITSKDEQKD